ncbi:MAG TPA: hypothetical protein VKH41_08535 [Myxococcota bacterium]|nr:hypothetical protein [Myxococcota bacterium]
MQTRPAPQACRKSKSITGSGSSPTAITAPIASQAGATAVGASGTAANSALLASNASPNASTSAAAGNSGPPAIFA